MDERDWFEWRGQVTAQIKGIEETSTIRHEKHTLEIKAHMDKVISDHEAKEMTHLKRINTFMFQTKIVGALVVIGLAIATQTTGLLT